MMFSSYTSPEAMSCTNAPIGCGIWNAVLLTLLVVYYLWRGYSLKGWYQPGSSMEEKGSPCAGRGRVATENRQTSHTLDSI